MGWLARVLDISLPLANKFYTWGWRGSLLGALFTAVSVGFLYWGTRVRDRDFEKNIAELHDRAASSEERSRGLENRSKELENETALANERTAELKLALEREIAARQPRTINPEQHAAIVQYLATAAPKGEIIVLSKLFDEEAERFGGQIISVLNDAGFIAKEGRGPFSFGSEGAWIVVRDLQKYQTVPNAIGAIQGAFRDILHIELSGTQRKDPFPDLGEVVIAIGRKP